MSLQTSTIGGNTKLKRFVRPTGAALGLLLACAGPVFAQSPSPHPSIDHTDEVWLMTCAALVFLMTPGLGLFYAGMVRAKNAMSVLMQSFVACGVITLQWVLWGYSLAFGPDHHGLIGDFSWICLNHVSVKDACVGYPSGVSNQVFMVYQMMFAIITPALISGAVVERMKFGAYLTFLLLWATLVYDPLAHWVWGTGGWLRTMGINDFAGGTVVETASGIGALVMAMFIGQRYRSGAGEDMRPHNLPLALLGGAILWFGWLGFNSGSAGGLGTPDYGGGAVGAFVATQIAMAAAAVSWMIADWLSYGKPTALGFISGAVAGGVAITPACGFVDPKGALIVGIGGGLICFFGIKLKNMFKADDSLDVMGVHGCGGIWGTIATGLFGAMAVGMTRAHQIQIQLIAVVATIAFVAVGTAVVAMITNLLFHGMRVPIEDENDGLDTTEHGETAYAPAEGALLTLQGTGS